MIADPSSLEQPRPRASDRWLVGVFLLLICAPGLLTPWGVARSEPERNGELDVVVPILRHVSGVGPWLQQVQDYLRLHFALRQPMIDLDARLKQGLALSSSYGSPVTRGRDGWLFYRVHRGTQGVRPELPFPPEELERWAQHLEESARLVTARGARLLVVVAPDKETIYPDLLPAGLPAARPLSRLDLLLARLHRGGEVATLDLRPALRDARRRGSPFERWPLYYRTDTHWNELGGTLAASEVLRRLGQWFPGVAPPSVSELVVTTETTPGGDLARMQSLQGSLGELRVKVELPVRCRFETSRARWASGPETPLTGPAELECPGAPVGRALILHDSMMNSMLPVLAPTFRRSAWRLDWQVEPELLDHERPDLVLIEFVERSLWEGPPGPPLAGTSGRVLR